jgi:hypothetical protein
MDEAAWQHEQTDVNELLAFIQPRTTERKLRLFACACLRRIGDGGGPLRPILATLEDYADDRATFDELRDLHDELRRGLLRRGPYADVRPTALAVASPKLDAGDVAFLAAQKRYVEARHRGWLKRRLASGGEQRVRAPDLEQVVDALGDAARTAERAAQAVLLREIIGNPFRPLTVNPIWLRWMFGTVPKLAEVIYNDRAFANLPILADALEEAGCDYVDLLEHCRSGDDHVRGCWVIDLLLAKE